jgi:hypothetical protein
MRPSPAVPAAAVSRERRDRLNDGRSESDTIDVLLGAVRTVASSDVSGGDIRRMPSERENGDLGASLLNRRQHVKT